MVQILESVDGAQASNAGAQPIVVAKRMKRSLNSVITLAYVFYQLKKGLDIHENAEDGTLTSITKLAERISRHMQLVVPRLQRVEPPPAQMLRFTNDIPSEIFTNRIIDLQVELVNIESGIICTGAPASTLEVKIFVVKGNLRSDDGKLRICKPLCPRNKATMPLLVQAASERPARNGRFKKNFVVKLHDGKAVAKVKITDNSSWVRCGMFKLVARAVKGSYQGRRIKEALSKPFAVKESKLEGRRKHAVPSPTDEPWRLINVGKEYDKRLQSIGIKNVQDFLNKLDSDPDELKRTLGMQNMKWESTVNHARKCRVTRDIEINVSNSREYGTGDSITSNLRIQQGNMDGTNLISMELGMPQMNEGLYVEHVGTSAWDANISNSTGNRIIPEPLLNSGVLNDGLLHALESQGMTMNDYTSWNQHYGSHVSIDDYFSIDSQGLQYCTLPNPMPQFQPEIMGMAEQGVFLPNILLDEPVPFANVIREGMGEHPNSAQLYSNQGGSDYSNHSEFFNCAKNGLERSSA